MTASQSALKNEAVGAIVIHSISQSLIFLVVEFSNVTSLQKTLNFCNIVWGSDEIDTIIGYNFSGNPRLAMNLFKAATH